MSDYSLPIDSAYLEESIGYNFKNKAILKRALTHSSYINEHRMNTNECNERLEFLGDSVLSIIVSTYIFSKYSLRMEGDLTKIRAAVVCEKALAVFAKEIRLGDYLILGNGEDKNNGRERPSVTSDAFEALLGAMYLDSDSSLETVSNFLLPFIIRAIDNLSSNDSITDYKTTLQQIVQQVEGEKLEYIVVDSQGPDHDKTYFVDAMLNANKIGTGVGKSKRAAEQNAAKEALKLFGVDANENKNT